MHNQFTLLTAESCLRAPDIKFKITKGVKDCNGKTGNMQEEKDKDKDIRRLGILRIRHGGGY